MLLLYLILGNRKGINDYEDEIIVEKNKTGYFAYHEKYMVYTVGTTSNKLKAILTIGFRKYRIIN